VSLNHIKIGLCEYIEETQPYAPKAGATRKKKEYEYRKSREELFAYFPFIR
jgi:hypothetical protein